MAGKAKPQDGLRDSPQSTQFRHSQTTTNRGLKTNSETRHLGLNSEASYSSKVSESHVHVYVHTSVRLRACMVGGGLKWLLIFLTCTVCIMTLPAAEGASLHLLLATHSFVQSALSAGIPLFSAQFTLQLIFAFCSATLFLS